MQYVDLSDIKYTGADIVPDLIPLNKEKYPKYDFKVLDLTTDNLPKVDLIFCRDCLFHLSNNLIVEALKNIKKSGSKYLLTTTFPEHKIANRDIEIGQWRIINLEIEPFFSS